MDPICLDGVSICKRVVWQPGCLPVSKICNTCMTCVPYATTILVCMSDSWLILDVEVRTEAAGEVMPSRFGPPGLSSD